MPVKSSNIVAKVRPVFLRFSQGAREAYSRLSKVQKGALWGLLAVLLLAAAGGIAYARTRPEQAAAGQEAEMQTAVARQGSLVLAASGTGTLVPARELTIGFETAGEVIAIEVKVGESVEAGQVLAVLDSSAQELALLTARLNLAEMTSPAAIATAQQAVAAAEKALSQAQVTRNNLSYRNQSVIDNAYAAYTLARQGLERARQAYEQVEGLSHDNPRWAAAYQSLYAAQLAANRALYVYNAYSGTPSQQAIDEADANLALAEAELEEAENYLAALTGGEVPADATGASLLRLSQARLAVESAQEDLDATRLKAPFSGTIMAVFTQVGENAGGGSAFTVADLSHAYIDFYMDQEDWTNVRVGYAVEVIFDALPEASFAGRVVEVSPGLVSAGGASMIAGTAELEKSIEEIQLPTGVSAALEVIAAQAEDVVLVPVEALHALSEGQYAVFVMVNGEPRLTMVEVGLQDETFAEIASGLQAGDVVTTGIVETGQ